MADQSKSTSPKNPGKNQSVIERAAMLIDGDPLRKLAGKVSPAAAAADSKIPTSERVVETPEPAGVQPAAGSEGSPTADDTPQQPNPHDASPDDDYSIQINDAPARQSKIFIPATEQSRSIEEFRQIKRSVLHKMYAEAGTASHNNNLILVTSTRPNEGKTFVSINLALSIASEKDLSVLLVDADQTNRGVRDALGISKGKRGLNDVIEDPSRRLEDCILETDVDGLSVLPAGTYHPLGTELLSSRRMEKIFEELARGRYGNVVIFDSPPALATTEASILAQKAGQVVFVVEADKTSQTAIADALEIIGNREKIGFVLNKTRVVVGDSQFGGYYSYGYGKPNAA